MNAPVVHQQAGQIPLATGLKRHLLGELRNQTSVWPVFCSACCMEISLVSSTGCLHMLQVLVASKHLHIVQHKVTMPRTFALNCAGC